MSNRKQRLELTWIGKNERPRLEPRILLEDEDKSYHAKARVTDDDIFDNILIHGDNLLALKALEQEYAGRVKCIYIDPPYNTGSAFRQYDDGVEHSIYLSLMQERISVLQRLLRQDGCFFVQADDNEGHYLKVLCDEIFGRKNFIATFLWRKVDSPNDNKVPVTPDHEFIFAYAKSIEHAALRQRPDGSLLDAYMGPDEQGRYYRDRLLKKNGKNSLRTDRPSMWFPVPGPDGKDVYPIHDDGREACWALGKQRVEEALRDSTLIWKNRGTDDAPRWVPYTREYASENPSRPFPTLWTDLPTTRQTKAHQKELFGAGNEFDTPKPEALIERVFQTCTSPGDLILDSFAGSGTTGAVAHKMGRRWIMVELGEHCATHVLPRLRKVIDGDDAGGITEAVEWNGGGGFRYYRLAPSLLEKDAWGNWVISKEYDPPKVAQAVCKLMGFVYQPDETHYWMQGRSSETDFIYVTTQSLTRAQLAALSEEVGDERTLLVCCKAFRADPDAFPNLTIRKIPQAVLRKCEWGKDDYSLNIANLPEASHEPDDPDDPRPPPRAGRKRGNGKEASQNELFSKGGRQVIDRNVRTISQRLSLRKPQSDSLEILADVLGRIDLSKDYDPEATLAAIRDTYPTVEAFEHDFPSLCFALATGVGKTRLMGAFISYLYLTGQSRHFFVLAPNKTIYEKLISDFAPESPKYVFKGIAEFAANPPLIVTGDNYESGVGVRFEGGRSSDLFGSDVHINIFNVDKINKEESPRGKPRMKRLQETIGESYYAYLSRLDDLVLLMDEAHRYRASAGANAIDGLKPILGLELTATPKAVGARPVPFRNVIYNYTLGQAMADGFVKEPAVATRKDFDPRSVGEQELEQIKLEDAVHHHDHVAVELDRYHRTTGAPKVTPFILIVAADTTEAKRLREFVESDKFFKARFKGKVAEVHSNLRGEESEEAMQRLVALEKDGSTEIVIHVNKLKEGWDVTNLYTIVPLRASASEILTEQTLGRGLRLPFGKRVSKGGDDEFAAVDRLTVIAHERFDDIIAKAREPGSIVMRTVEIGEGGDISVTGATLVTAPSIAEMIVTGAQPEIPGFSEQHRPAFIFKSAEEGKAAQVTLEVIKRYERKLGSAEALRERTVQQQIANEVRDLVRPVQGTLDGVVEQPRIEQIVETVAITVADRTISLPQIVVLPKKQVTFTFEDFDLANLESVNMRPIEDGIIIEDLRTQARVYLARALDDPREARPEDYLVRYLIERNEIDYDAHATLLYKLAGQMVSRIKSYLADDAEVENVLLRHGRQLADFIFAQMMNYYRETPLGEDDYEVTVTRGFMLLQAQPMNVPQGQRVRDFKQAVAPLSDTRKHVFGGFQKCCYPLQKFDTDPERRIAVTIDGDASVEKWLKPGRNQFRIDYRSGETYEPDFVVETKTRMLICEVKAKNELEDPIVKAKAAAATKWCKTATQYAGGAKPWTYLLIPDDQITGSATLDGLAAKFATS